MKRRLVSPLVAMLVLAGEPAVGAERLEPAIVAPRPTTAALLFPRSANPGELAPVARPGNPQN